MKRNTMLRLFSVVTAASAALFFTSCGEKKDGDASADKEQKADTPDGLTDELITQLNALADALGSAKDKASADEAVKKLDGIADEIDSIAKRLDKLETPSEDEKKRLEEKMTKATDAMQEKMKGAMTTMMTNQEVGAVIGPAMQKFGQRMDKLDPIFERFGKGSK